MVCLPKPRVSKRERGFVLLAGSLWWAVYQFAVLSVEGTVNPAITHSGFHKLRSA